MKVDGARVSSGAGVTDLDALIWRFMRRFPYFYSPSEAVSCHLDFGSVYMTVATSARCRKKGGGTPFWLLFLSNTRASIIRVYYVLQFKIEKVLWFVGDFWNPFLRLSLKPVVSILIPLGSVKERRGT